MAYGSTDREVVISLAVALIFFLVLSIGIATDSRNKSMKLQAYEDERQACAEVFNVYQCRTVAVPVFDDSENNE